MNYQPPTLNTPYVLIRADSQCELGSLDAEQIKPLFRQYGAILFRDFELNVSRFREWSDHFCHHYVDNKSPGRNRISGDGRVQSVNLGQRAFPLHPELAREPWQPDIAWFYCQHPAQSKGETTICDGIEIVHQMPEELRNHLSNNVLAHVQPTDIDWCRLFYRRADLQIAELLNNDDTYPFKFSVVNQQLYRTYLRPMLHKPLFSNHWAYGNFLVFARRNLNVRHFPCYHNGEEVDDNLVDQLEQISNDLATAVHWQKSDVLMLDNTRFMHGRNDIGGDPRRREILTQFGYCSFLPDDFADRSRQFWRQP